MLANGNREWGFWHRVTKMVVPTCCSAQRSVDQFLFYVAAHELSTANLGNCGKNGAASNAEVTDGFTWTRQALYQFDRFTYWLLSLGVGLFYFV